MTLLVLLSDQFLTWSAHGRYSVVDFTQASRPVAATNAGSGYATAWLAHRTLQALRQACLQVRRWARSWPQVLSVRELSRAPTANGLRASGRLRRRHPRTITPPRGALRRTGEPASTVARHPHRSAVGRRTHRQHARSLACRRVHAETVRGAPQ